jgi:hypothetical protein
MAFEFQVTAPDRSTRITRPEPTDGGGPVPSFELAPGERYAQRHVLDRWLRFDQVGSYAITIHFTGKVRPHHPSVAIDSDFGRPVTVQVLPRDEQRLQRRLVSLRNSIMLLGTVESVRAAEELAFVRDPAAVLYLRQAIEVNPPFMAWMMERLAEIGTPDAKSAVQALVSHPDPTVARTAAQALTRMK